MFLLGKAHVLEAVQIKCFSMQIMLVRSIGFSNTPYVWMIEVQVLLFLYFLLL